MDIELLEFDTKFLFPQIYNNYLTILRFPDLRIEILKFNSIKNYLEDRQVFFNGSRVNYNYTIEYDLSFSKENADIITNVLDQHLSNKTFQNITCYFTMESKRTIGILRTSFVALEYNGKEPMGATIKESYHNILQLHFINNPVEIIDRPIENRFELLDFEE